MAFRSPLVLSRFLLVPTVSVSALLACQQQQQQQPQQSYHLPNLSAIRSNGSSSAAAVLRCDAPALKTTTTRKNSSGLDARVVRQISSGSIIGLVCGAAVAYLSKPLAILLGVFIAGVQYLEYNGVHIVPYGRLQQYFKSIDLKSAVRDDPAFKVAFGITFALAGFGSL